MSRKKPAEKPPEPPPPEPPAAPPARTKLSRGQFQERLRDVADLMKVGYDDARIVWACRTKWGVGRATARRYQELVRLRWAREEERERPHRKAQLIRSVQHQIVALSQRISALEPREDVTEVHPAQRGNPKRVVTRRGTSAAEVERIRARYHALIERNLSFLADLTGAREPIKVEVEAAEAKAVLGVLAELTPERLRAMRERQRETQELAEKARVLLRLPGGAEVVERRGPVLSDPG